MSVEVGNSVVLKVDLTAKCAKDFAKVTKCLYRNAFFPIKITAIILRQQNILNSNTLRYFVQIFAHFAVKKITMHLKSHQCILQCYLKKFVISFLPKKNL